MAKAIVDLYPGENLFDYFKKSQGGKLFYMYHALRGPLLLNNLATPLKSSRYQKVSGK
jgi:hypothetical protein